MRDRFEGLGPFIGVAAVFFFVGVLAILLEVQSPSFVQWDGIKVQGDTYKGVTSYTWHGSTYALDNKRVPVSDTRHIPTTVWLDRSHPDDTSKAYIENGWNRWVDFGYVMLWFFVAAVIVSVGLIRRVGRRRRRSAVTGDFGTGLHADLVRRIIEQRGQPPPRPVPTDDD